MHFRSVLEFRRVLSDLVVQGAVAGGTLFQVDQATPESEELRGHQHERGSGATVDCLVRVSSGGVHQISEPLGAVYLADFAASSAQPV